MKLMDSFWPALVLAGVLGAWGLGWGLPSAARTHLFLRPDQQNSDFYRSIEKARDDYYSQIGNNPMAHVGRMAREGKSYHQSENILSSYSSYLVRTHHGDEQANLVMLSHLNPLQGKWYPYSYGYGGAYLYSLACYLGALHAVHLIRLVPQTSFYYANPDEMGKIFLAARGWSVLGLLVSILPLFFIAKRLGGSRIAFWTSCFYALLPATIGTAKLAKPHVWAAGWIFWALLAGLRAKEDAGVKYIALAGLGYGLALGTTMSQAAFFPLFIWVCWTPSWVTTLRRAAVIGAATLGGFLITNFYIFAHYQDFRDEVFFYNRFSPFGFRAGAFLDFLYGTLRPSFGRVMWGAWCVGTVGCLLQKNHQRIRALALLSLAIFGYVACQIQSQNGDPVASRLCLAFLGMGCLFVAYFLHQQRWGAWLSGALLALLLIKGIIYDLHFVSDQAPRDNASLAGIWIMQNLPPKTVIGHTQKIPHVIEFPPVDFERYRILSFDNPAFGAAAEPVYAVIPDWAYSAWRQPLLDRHFVLVKSFAQSPLQKLGYSDPFTTANFSIEIYKRGT